MKKHFSGLLAWTVLLVKAATLVIPAYSTDMLLSAAAVLVVLGVVLFANQKQSFAAKLPWVVAGGVLICFELPCGPFNLDFALSMIESLLVLLNDLIVNAELILASLALILVQVFFRKKTQTGWILLRYALAMLVVLLARAQLFPNSDLYANVLILLTILCFARECNGSMHGKAAPSMLRWLMLLLFFLVVGVGGRSPSTARQINDLLSVGTDDWVITLVIAFVTGLLILLDDYQRSGKNMDKVYQSQNSGLAMLFWCLLVLVMKIWKAFYSTEVLFAVFPLTYIIGNSMFHEIENEIDDDAEAFSDIWAFLGIIQLMLAKSLNMGLLLSYILEAILLVAWLFWDKLFNLELSRLNITNGLGIGAIVIMVSSQLTSLRQVGESAGYLLGAVLGVAILGLLSRLEGSLGGSASRLYPGEFDSLWKTRTFLSGLLMLIAVVRVLFFL